MAYLLSLCIPTYNRADVLDDALAALLGDPDFDSSKIEVVVSDNCSPDHTRQVVEKYPGVRYFCNEENIRDANFSRALLRGQGAYVRLMNDTVRMRRGGLRKILTVIERHLDSQPPLLFVEKGGPARRIHCRTLDQFTDCISYRATWIGNFGLWKKDLHIVEDLSGSALHLLQVAWCYRLAAAGPVTVYTDHYCTVVQLPSGGKGGYNLFKVFVDNYLEILRGYLDAGSLSEGVFEREKRRLFKNFIWRYMRQMLLGSESLTNYGVDNAWEILLRNFGRYPWFHWKMLLFTLRRHK